MMVGGFALLTAAAVAAAHDDPRAVLPAADLHGILASRGLACEGCTTAELLAKVQASDEVAAELASEGRLSVLVRYCAA